MHPVFVWHSTTTLVRPISECRDAGVKEKLVDRRQYGSYWVSWMASPMGS